MFRLRWLVISRSMWPHVINVSKCAETLQPASVRTFSSLESWIGRSNHALSSSGYWKPILREERESERQKWSMYLSPKYTFKNASVTFMYRAWWGITRKVWHPGSIKTGEWCNGWVSWLVIQRSLDWQVRVSDSDMMILTRVLCELRHNTVSFEVVPRKNAPWSYRFPL